MAQHVKTPPAMQETWVQSLGWEDPLQEGMVTHSSILAGESHGQRSLVGYSPQGHKELALSHHFRQVEKGTLPSEQLEAFLSLPGCGRKPLQAQGSGWRAGDFTHPTDSLQPASSSHREGHCEPVRGELGTSVPGTMAQWVSGQPDATYRKPPSHDFSRSSPKGDVRENCNASLSTSL